VHFVPVPNLPTRDRCHGSERRDETTVEEIKPGSFRCVTWSGQVWMVTRTPQRWYVPATWTKHLPRGWYLYTPEQVQRFEVAEPEPSWPGPAGPYLNLDDVLKMIQAADGPSFQLPKAVPDEPPATPGKPMKRRPGRRYRGWPSGAPGRRRRTVPKEPSLPRPFRIPPGWLALVARAHGNGQVPPGGVIQESPTGEAEGETPLRFAGFSPSPPADTLMEIGRYLRRNPDQWYLIHSGTKAETRETAQHIQEWRPVDAYQVVQERWNGEVGVYARFRPWPGYDEDPEVRVTLSAGVGAHLRRERRRQGLATRRLGEMLGVTESTIWSWESGATRPTSTTVLQWTAALGITPAEAQRLVLGEDD
jgi:DNA-binding XRE family transcriptional regulator